VEAERMGAMHRDLTNTVNDVRRWLGVQQQWQHFYALVEAAFVQVGLKDDILEKQEAEVLMAEHRRLLDVGSGEA